MIDKSQKFIIDIAPLTRIPLTRNQTFSYESNEKIPVGSLVEIPLFKRKVEGIVMGSRDDFHRLGNIELKKVEKIIEESFLDEKQLELAKWMSEYYISPLGIILKSFVPKRAKSRNTKHETFNKNKKSLVLTKEQKTAVEEIAKDYSKFKIQNSKFLLFGPAGAGKTEVYIHSILEIRKKNPSAQFLILLPELTLTPQAIERYGEYFKEEEITIINSNISAGEFFKNWSRIKSGEAKVIIASRKGAFSPFVNLQLIVVDEEQDMSHKQWDMNPRYDARTVAEKLVELHQSKIIFGSATPRVESYYRAENKKLSLIEIPALNLEESSRHKDKENLDSSFLMHTSFELVDMKKERWAKNYSLISKKLRGEIAYALKNKLQTILFVNRQGMSNFSICAKCKTVLRCPKCERALTYNNTGKYSCLHCSYTTSILPHCENCKSVEFKNVGLGTQKVEREATNLFPGAKIARIDSQAIREKLPCGRPGSYQEKIYQDFSQRKIDILIGTQMISKGWDLPNVALVGIIDADNMLAFPDFSAEERAYQTFTQLSGRVGRPGSKWPGTVIIQTFQPENKLIRSVVEKNQTAFYDSELKERKALTLPPFGKMVRLVFQDISKVKAEKETDRVFSYLSAIKNIKVSFPEDAFVPKIRGRYRKILVIRIKDSQKIPPEVSEVLRKLGSGWIVDVDPISII